MWTMWCTLSVLGPGTLFSVYLFFSNWKFVISTTQFTCLLNFSSVSNPSQNHVSIYIIVYILRSFLIIVFARTVIIFVIFLDWKCEFQVLTFPCKFTLKTKSTYIQLWMNVSVCCRYFRHIQLVQQHRLLSWWPLNCTFWRSFPPGIVYSSHCHYNCPGNSL